MLLNCTAFSSSSSDPSEDCSSEAKSTPSLSRDYLSCDDSSFCEDIILLDDMSRNVCFSGDLILPIQGTWGPKGKKRGPNLQKLLQDDPHQIYKLGVTGAWPNDFGESTAHKNIRGGKGLPDRYPKDEPKLTEGTLNGLVKLLKTFQGGQMDNEEIQKDNDENQNTK